jgi:hypothetical protein
MYAGSAPGDRPARGHRPAVAALLLFALGAAAGGLFVHFLPRPAVPASDGLPPRRLEAVVYLPTQPNPDRPFTPKDWDDALDLLVREMGGATLGPTAEGCWLGAGGKVQRETVRLVVVTFERERLDALRGVLRRVGKKLGQEAIYVRLEQPRIEVLAVDP